MTAERDAQAGENAEGVPANTRRSIGSLCTGIGGLDLAVEAHFDADLAWYSEIEPAPCEILRRVYPDVKNHGDLTLIDWASVEPVDILTAGYPCQPFSSAGRRKGASDVRHLWPYIAEAVRVLRPRYVVLENVRGHLTLGFDAVLGDLAEAGFDAEWCVLRASDVGAPHLRARVWIVARNADSASQDPRTTAGASRDAARQSGGSPADAHEGRRDGRGPSEPAAQGDGHEDGLGRPAGAGSDPADTDGERFQGGSQPNIGPLEPAVEASRRDDVGGLVVAEVAWAEYEPAIRRWEHLLGRPAPRPTDEQGRLDPPFVEWMMGYPHGWIDGLTRTQKLKALGNAVVPQQALAALAELAPLSGAAA